MPVSKDLSVNKWRKAGLPYFTTVTCCDVVSNANWYNGLFFNLQHSHFSKMNIVLDCKNLNCPVKCAMSQDRGISLVLLVTVDVVGCSISAGRRSILSQPFYYNSAVRQSSR